MNKGEKKQTYRYREQTGGYQWELGREKDRRIRGRNYYIKNK